MDKLFSNIDQNFSNLQNNMNQNVSTKTLLQRQQISQDKINELLQKSADSLMCGPTCQKLKVTEELKQKYLDAETNMQTAPIKLEQSKKNYYIYTEGTPYYNNMKEEELKNKSEQISKLIEENFNEEFSSTNTMNLYLNTALINSENTEELLKEYLEKNQVLKLNLEERNGDILTNDRKTYYEKDALERLKLWYRFLWWVYYIAVLVIILSLIFSKSELKWYKKIIISLLLLFYPYYISLLVNWLYGIWLSIIKKIPTNVYNDL